MRGDFIINEKKYNFEFGPYDKLLHTLRENGFKEVKNGCEEAHCGACMVLIEGKPSYSCHILTGSATGKNMKTVKGVGDIYNPHPIQTAFVETGAVQCGFCTPSKILSAYALLSKNKNPSDEDIKKAFDGNYCRCTGYVKIIEAVRLAASRMK